MKILITSPASQVGSRVLGELLCPEISVRVVAPDRTDLSENLQEKVEIVRGRIDDVETLVRALDGVDSVFWSVPSVPRAEINIHAHYERFADAMCRAVRRMGTPRIVTLSAFGKVRVSDASPIAGLQVMEDILIDSGAPIRHLRCGLFMEGLLRQARSIGDKGIFSFPISGDVAMPLVAADDVADESLKWLVRPDWQGIESLAVLGPERLSFTQVAAALELVLQRPVKYLEAPANQFVQALIAMGASIKYARGLVQMYEAIAQGAGAGNERIARPGTSTTLSGWAERYLLPILGPVQTAC
jgi:uncharacterized protein YbjT (DUF2867 family)